MQNQLLLEEIEQLRQKELDLQAENEDLRKKLAHVKETAEVSGHTGTSESPSQVASASAYETGGISAQVTMVYPTHPNLRDPQTSQTSLHLGLFPESFVPNTSRRPSQRSPTDPEGESSIRWERYRGQE